MTKEYRIGDKWPKDIPTCIVPWTSITLSASGDIKPCCKFTSDQRIAKEAGKKYDPEASPPHMNIYQGYTLQDAWEGMEKLRQAMLKKEKPPGCQDCWKNESTAGVSRRQWMLEKIDNRPNTYLNNPPMNLKHMDLNFGNTCNLKCRMCGSWGSTHWFKEDKKLQQINPQFKRQLENSTVRNIDSSLYRNMEDKLSQMERIDFKGGEPLMQDGMYEVLEMLVANGSAPNVTLGYVTNGTKTPERLLELWPHFKRVILNVSIEATNDLYQYIRGSNIQTIEQLEQNLKWYDQFDNVKGHFSVAISIYNIFDLQNLADWQEKVTSNLRGWKTLIAARTSDSIAPGEYHRPNSFPDIVTKPAYLDINNIPPHLKQRVLDKWDKNYHAMDYLRDALKNPKYKEKEWELFKHFTRELDRIRGTNVLDYIPELEGEF
tara:strand:+ start:564 stop:1856 length:1293 start_codon:yes stop_codon:yes gene_type:complete